MEQYKMLKNREFERYLNTQPHEDVLKAFVGIADEVKDKDYWSLLRGVWTRGEDVQPRDLWRKLLMRHPYDSAAIMTREEQVILDRLPNIIDIYRGSSNESYNEGFSFTLDEQRAEWFAHRYTGPQGQLIARFRLSHFREDHEVTPLLIRGTVEKKDILAYIDDRGEDEIIVLPENVKIEEVTEL